MSSSHKQHLNSDDMRTIDAALARVRSLYGLNRGSEEDRHVAAVMVGEFQLGNTTEDGLYAIFLGPSEPASHARRKQQMRLALKRWEDGATVALERAA